MAGSNNWLVIRDRFLLRADSIISIRIDWIFQHVGLSRTPELILRDMKPIIRFRKFISDFIKTIYKTAAEMGKKITYPNKKYKPDISDKYYSFPGGGRGVIELKNLRSEIVTSKYFNIENSWHTFTDDKQWKLKRYFNKDEIDNINTAFKKEVFGDDKKVIMVIASNHFGDGSFPVCVDNDNKIIIQCGLIFNNFIARIDDVNIRNTKEQNLLEDHYR